MTLLNDLSGYFSKATRYWQSRSARERVLVTVALTALMLTAIYHLYWKPAHRAIERLRVAVPLAQTQLAEMRIQSMMAPRSTASQLTGGLLPALEKSLETHGIRENLRSLEPRNETTAQVTFEQIEYTQLVKWLLNLDRQFGVRVNTTTISASDVAGTVTARITLSSRS